MHRCGILSSFLLEKCSGGALASEASTDASTTLHCPASTSRHCDGVGACCRGLEEAVPVHARQGGSGAVQCPSAGGRGTALPSPALPQVSCRTARVLNSTSSSRPSFWSTDTQRSVCCGGSRDRSTEESCEVDPIGVLVPARSGAEEQEQRVHEHDGRCSGRTGRRHATVVYLPSNVQPGQLDPAAQP